MIPPMAQWDRNGTVAVGAKVRFQCLSLSELLLKILLYSTFVSTLT